MAAFDPSIPGIFIFGFIAGTCTCSSVLCPTLIGYLTGGDTKLSLPNILKLTLAFCTGTTIVLLPLGVIAGFIGQDHRSLNETIAWSIGTLSSSLWACRSCTSINPRYGVSLAATGQTVLSELRLLQSGSISCTWHSGKTREDA
ncbi:MAG: hypothetical protein ABFC24_06415 [Methanoregulaceae archaeon]